MSQLERFDKLSGYIELRKWLNSLRDRKLTSSWADAVRWYIENDLFFVASEVISDGKTINTETDLPLYFHQFYLDWCRSIEIQIAAGGGFDGSARGSGKSTLRTKAANIQRIVRYPNSTGSIFSFQKAKARKHYRGIKEELESNEILRTVCDDVLFWDPRAAAKNGDTVWSLSDGLRVKGSTRKDQTLEYNAFLDGTPTGGRFDWMDFDDIEDYSVVSSEEMLEKQHSTYDSTILLLTPTALKQPVEMFTNTFYSDKGLAKRVYDRLRRVDGARVRVRPGEDLDNPGDGPLGGTPEFPFTKRRLYFFFDKIKDKREYAVQICCDFQAGENRRFADEWLLRYPGPPDAWGKGKNIYICIDPSRGLHDPTAIWVWALGADHKASWVDGSLKKLDPALPAFYDEIFRLAAKWSGLGKRLVEIRVENFGQATYAAHIAKEIAANGYAWRVVACADNMRTGLFSSGKRDREFERWAGPASRGDVLIPEPSPLGPGLIRSDEKGERVDLVSHFLEYEWSEFPHCLTDNLLDAGSLLWEPEDKLGVLQYPIHPMRKRIYARSKGETFMSAG